MKHLLFLSSLIIPCISDVTTREHGKGREHRRQRNAMEIDPCLDNERITDRVSLTFPTKYSNLDRPWLRRDLTPKILSSEGLRYQWTWVKNLPVRGLGTITVEDVIRFMDTEGCFYLVWGTIVRDAIMKRKPTRVEGETNCDLENLQEACIKRFGFEKCTFETLDDGHSVLLIGDPHEESPAPFRGHPLSVYDWNTTFNIEPKQWDYTINTLSIYDNQAGEVYIIDPTGRGFSDICDRLITPSINDWDNWAVDSPEKIVRYYHLRSLGFRDSNSNFHEFITEQMGHHVNKKAIQEVYCSDILDGGFTWAGESATTTCHLVEPDNERRRRIADAREIMQTELGSIWEQNILPEIEDLEAIYVTEHAVDLVKHGPRSDKRAAVAVNRIESRPLQRNRTVSKDGKVINLKPIRHKEDWVTTSEEGDEKLRPVGGFVHNSEVLSSGEDRYDELDDEDTEDYSDGDVTGTESMIDNSPFKATSSAPSLTTPTYFCMVSCVFYSLIL